MGSTRLPGKIMCDLAGQSVLFRVVERLSRARRLDEIMIATTTQPADDAVADLCHARAWNVFRGSENDVLDRYYHAAQASQADVVVRVTSDCPLVDAGVVDAVIADFLTQQPGLDYSVTEGFPRGLDTEVFRADALARAWREARDPALREHVTAHLYKHPEDYKLRSFIHRPDCSHHRWTVDTAEDLRLVQLIFEHFPNAHFSWQEALALVASHAEWNEINAHIRQKEI